VSLGRAEARGNRRSEGIQHKYLGDLAALRDDVDAAAKHYRRAREIAEALADPESVAEVLRAEGRLRVGSGAFDDGMDRLRDAMYITGEIADPGTRTQVLADATVGEVARGNAALGARLAGAVAASLRRLDLVLERHQQLELEAAATAARSALGDEAFATAYAQGERLDLDAAADLVVG
jgi:hypothetical protein